MLCHLPKAGGKHGLPQWKKNLMLKEKLKAMEDDLKITVRNAELQSDLNVSRYTEYINGKDHLESLSSTLRQSKDDTVSSYTNAVSVKNDNVTRLKLILNLKKSNFVNYYPEWMRFMQKIREVRDEHGYSNKTKWRTVVGKLLREGSRAFGERNGQGEKVLGDFRRLCVSFNAFGHKELEEELNKLEDKAGDVEAEHDPTFQVLRLEYRMARDNWREASSKKPYLDPTVQVFQSTKLEMQALAKKNRDLLGIKHEDSVLERLDHRKAAKMEEEEKTKEEMKLALRLPVTKDNESKQITTYNNFLAYCSNSGDWVGAFKAYREYVRRGFVPNKFVFGCLIGACKHAEPVQVDRAILLLDQMLENEVAPTIATYNNVIDCCRAGHAWRRGVQVFERMMKDGTVKPNTNTYSIVAKLGFEAKNDEAGEVYSALKFAGVPEYIAYTSAAGNSLKVKDGGGRMAKSRRKLQRELDIVEFEEEAYREQVLTEKEIRAGEKMKKEMQAKDIQRAVERILTLGGGKARGMGLDDDLVSSRSESRAVSRK
ncbi:hypothetical protein TrLO_g4225 [Triparma laevis f. longispina]|uniref:Pentatricopeptide repeat-containing protein n=1 Tax=Triparma laevis f. longispina TaxID=1714387 RepID=A0A9W7EDA8_9STRA|nr:hypothetical protein TrLO_g4225 [Triparma laevis f. longispina]